jgi:hypothetical protein
MKTKLIVPQINLNGTDRDTLLDQQCNVRSFLVGALRAMQEAAPNGRDYQLRPADLAPAVAAWRERMQMIEALAREIEEHAIAIQNA